MPYLIFHIIIFIKFVLNGSSEYESIGNNMQINHPDNINNIRILDISYEISYDIQAILKVKIKTIDKILKNITFNAFLKAEGENKEFSLECLNELEDLIVCSSLKNIFFNTKKKYLFSYNTQKSKKNLTINGKESYEDSKRISLIFHPKIPNHQILYKNNKKLFIINEKNMIYGGYLFITRKTKKILKPPENGFNKYIELNNFIPRAGLGIYMPQWTLIAYQEAIRRGYKMVDADILFTKDEIPVIAHDILLEKVSNGEGRLIDKTLAELEKLDFGIKFSKKYEGQKILKFEVLLKLCKENNLILDLDLNHLDYTEFLTKKYYYLNIIIKYVEKYDMINSIVFNDKRQEILDIMKIIRKDISLSINGMNEKNNIEKIKDKYKDSKIVIYNMGHLQAGKTINEDAVKYGKSLGKKVKASKIDNIDFANKVISWGVNFICTNKLNPFLMKNEKEEPIKVRCKVPKKDSLLSICEIEQNITLIDNENYNIYYSTNIYNLSRDIVEIPIGEFKYVDTNKLNKLYYKLSYLDFNRGIIRLITSNIVKAKDRIIGYIGPDYENAAKCYHYKYICKGNGNNNLHCYINKSDSNIVKFKGNYKIYSLDGYSFNPIEVKKNSKYLEKEVKEKKSNILIILLFIKSLILKILLTKKKKFIKFNK